MIVISAPLFNLLLPCVACTIEGVIIATSVMDSAYLACAFVFLTANGFIPGTLVCVVWLI